MRKIILDKLSAFNLELLSMRQRLDSRSHLLEEKYPLLEKCNQHVLLWLLEWQDGFCRDASSATSAAKLKKVFQRKSLELRAFFHLRYHYLPFGIADFTQAPFLLPHRALLSAAELMVEENESVCQMMMPWVERVIGSADEADIKSATEELNGDFKLNRFVTAGADSKTLIAVMDYLDYVRDSPAIAKRFFDSSHSAILERVFRTPLRNYVRALEYFYRCATLDKSCFAYHIHRLAMSLHERSASRGGSEYDALHQYENVIAEFYALWNALPLRDRVSLSLLKIDPSEKFNLKDYLLVVFASAPAVKMQLSTEELTLEHNNNIINCANILSSTLLNFLHRYAEAWTRLTVGASTNLSQSVVYTRDQLNQFKEVLFETVDNPKKRPFLSSDSLLLSMNKQCQVAYNELIAVTTLLFSVNEATFEYFFRDFKRSFFSPQDVLTFFSLVNDKACCTQFWVIHHEQWKKLFFLMDDIMVLTHFLNERGINIVLDDFKKEIIDSYRPASFLYANNPRLAFSFMLAVVKKFPNYVRSMRGLLNCMMICETQQELELFFSNITSGLLFLFSVDGKSCANRWIIFLDMLSAELRSRTFGRIDSRLIYTACFEYILPVFISKESMQNYWDKEPTGCFSCLFRRPRIDARDLFVYDALLDHYQQHTRDDGKIAIEGLVKIIDCLKAFVEQNEGGQFLKAVRESFHRDFFKKTSDALSLIRHETDFEMQALSPMSL